MICFGFFLRLPINFANFINDFVHVFVMTHVLLVVVCVQGSECEFRHSDVARMNPRDCFYWLNGNCLNPKCPFRHPVSHESCFYALNYFCYVHLHVMIVVAINDDYLNNVALSHNVANFYLFFLVISHLKDWLERKRQCLLYL